MRMLMSKEYKAVLVLALVMAVRMLGLFLILPVFSLHAVEYAHANIQWIGLALGVYGLTQAILQTPLGLLSDKIGRKPVMAMGLGFFVLGSIVAAVSHSIYGIVLGRALQGAGAIGSTILALIADITSEENRSKAMGIIGLFIGLSFAVAMIISPLLNAWAGLAGIFWFSAALALFAECLVWKWAPKPSAPVAQKPGQWPQNLKRVLQDANLLRLDAGIFSLHAILTAFFIVVPGILERRLHLTAVQQALGYLITLSAAFVLMLPFLIFAEKKQRLKPVFLTAIGFLGGIQLLLSLLPISLFSTLPLLLLFFTAFTLLEAVLPSWISKVAPAHCKGVAMGIYSSSQFLGIFCGGLAGGWLYSHYGASGILWAGTLASLVWLVTSRGLTPPFSTAPTEIYPLSEFLEPNQEKLVEKLYGIAGIIQVTIMEPEAAVYIKIDLKITHGLQLRQSLENSKLIAISLPQKEELAGKGLPA